MINEHDSDDDEIKNENEDDYLLTTQRIFLRFRASALAWAAASEVGEKSR